MLDEIGEMIVTQFGWQVVSRSNGSTNGSDGKHERADWHQLETAILQGMDVHDNGVKLAGSYIAASSSAEARSRLRAGHRGCRDASAALAGLERSSQAPDASAAAHPAQSPS